MSALLRVENLRVSAHAGPVSFSVPPAGRLALLGSHPAPLSTLMDAIAGHQAIAAGQIVLEDRVLNGLPPEHRGIGLMSARDPLFGHLDVRGNVAFGLRARKRPAGEQQARVDHVMALMGLDGLGSRAVADLDTHYRARVKLARLVAFGPRVVLLDDPLAGLDAEAARSFTRLIARLGTAQEMAVILATARREDALNLACPIALFEGSQWLQTGTAPQLLDRPGDERVARAFGDANLLRGAITQLENDVAIVHLATGGTMEALAMPGLTEGALCTLCIRPDRIAPLFPSARGSLHDDQDGTLQAQLADSAHLGDHVRLRFRLADGTEVTAHRPPLAAQTGLTAGRPALLAWQPNHAMAFPIRAEVE